MKPIQGESPGVVWGLDGPVPAGWQEMNALKRAELAGGITALDLWRLKPEMKKYSVYRHMWRLATLGLVRMEWAGVGPKGGCTRKVYRVTDLGRVAIAAFDAAAEVWRKAVEGMELPTVMSTRTLNEEPVEEMRVEMVEVRR
jgi:DNA-binding PadR family transcriptional regulator